MRINQNKNVFIGLAFVILGLIYLGGTLGFWPFISIWSIAFIAVTLLLGISLIIAKNYIGGFFFLGLALSRGIYYLPAPYDDMLDISTWNILVIALLFGIGLQILTKKSNDSYHNRKSNYNSSYTTENMFFDMDEQTINDDATYDSTTQHEEQPYADYQNANEKIYINASFNEVNRYVLSQEFNGGTLNCSFGSVTLHLTQANLSASGAHLSLHCSFCDVTIYVPRTWAVNNQISNTFAAVNDDRSDIVDNTVPCLMLTGKITFGEVKIVYV